MENKKETNLTETELKEVTLVEGDVSSLTYHNYQEPIEYYQLSAGYFKLIEKNHDTIIKIYSILV